MTSVIIEPDQSLTGLTVFADFSRTTGANSVLVFNQVEGFLTVDAKNRTLREKLIFY